MNATTTGPQVAAYVSAVREHLADLSPDVVEELTGGLEADLRDALDGDGSTPAVYGTPSPRERFGDPRAYAEELRSAAGLPPRTAVGPSIAHLRKTFGDMREFGLSTSAPLRAQPWWPAVSGFLVTLRPVWWVLRGWLGYMLIAILWFPYAPWPGTFLGVVLLIVLFVGSVELGRRTAAGALGGRWLAGVGVSNVVALLLLVPALAVLNQSHDAYAAEYDGSAPTPSDGIYNEGTGVHNVFPYDENGTLLHDVRLLDENGRPIVPGDVGSRYDANGRQYAPVERQPADGSSAYNVFPLRERPYGDSGVEQPVQDAPPPAVALPPLASVASPTAAPSASASASVSPSAVPSVSPSAVPSVSPSAVPTSGTGAVTVP